MKNDTLLVKSVEKAFAVLSAFDTNHVTLSLTELATKTKLDKSAAQRFTHTLVQLGYLRKCADTKRFQLSPKVLELGAGYTRTHGLVRRAIPYLIRISVETNESVSLTELDGLHVVYLQRLLSRNILSSSSVVTGTRLPAYCTAAGIAILSGLPQSEAEDIIARSELKQLTPNTIFDAPSVMKNIRLAAEQGFSLADNQVFMNYITVAVPIYNAERRSVAAVSVGASKLNWSLDDAVARFVPILTAAASALSD